MHYNLLYKDDTIEISCETGNRWLYANWKGMHHAQSVIKGCELILNYMKEQKVTKLLNDNSDISGVWWDAAEWIAQVWFPEMLTLGLEQVAWVFSPSQFSEMSAKKTLGQVSKFLTIEFEAGKLSQEQLMQLIEMGNTFHAIPDAEEWLLYPEKHPPQLRNIPPPVN